MGCSRILIRRCAFSVQQGEGCLSGFGLNQDTKSTRPHLPLNHIEHVRIIDDPPTVLYAATSAKTTGKERVNVAPYQTVGLNRFSMRALLVLLDHRSPATRRDDTGCGSADSRYSQLGNHGFH